jgi:hypothetical protein
MLIGLGDDTTLGEETLCPPCPPCSGGGSGSISVPCIIGTQQVNSDGSTCCAIDGICLTEWLIGIAGSALFILLFAKRNS